MDLYKTILTTIITASLVSCSGISYSTNKSKSVFFISPSNPNITLGETRSYVLQGAEDCLVYWESSNPEVASISTSGFLRTYLEGETTITAFCEYVEKKLTLNVISLSQSMIDTSFGNNGLVFDDSDNSVKIKSAGLLSNDHIAIAGYIEPIVNSSKQNFLLLLYDHNGNKYKDVSTSISNTLKDDHAYSLLVQSDNKIILGGGADCSNYGYVFYEKFETCRELAMARYTENGDLDTSFGNLGKVKTAVTGSIYATIHSISLQQDGKIVVAGNTVDSWPYDRKIILARYHSNGQLDTSFGTNGFVKTQIASNDYTEAIVVKVQDNGKIIVGGYTKQDYHLVNQFLVLRYNSNGSLDTSFNGTGYVKTSIDSNVSNEEVYDLVINTDEKIIAVGKSSYSDYERVNYVFGLVKYNVDGSLDSSFGNYGKLIVDINEDNHASNNWATKAVLHNDTVIIGGVYDYDYYGTVMALARIGLDGALTQNLIQLILDMGTIIKEHKVGAVLVQSSGKIVLVAESNNVTMQRLLY